MTAVTLKVIVFGLWSVSTPLLAVPPSSITWKVKVETPVPLLLSAGVQVMLGMLASVTTWPVVMATPESLSVPVVGKVVILTLAKALAGLSLGSVKPKSAAASATAVSSSVVRVLSAPAGASLTGITVMVVTAAAELSPPSLTTVLMIRLPASGASVVFS